MDKACDKLVSDLLAEIAKAVRLDDADRIKNMHSLVFSKSPKTRLARTSKSVKQSTLPLHEAEALSDFPSREALDRHLKSTYTTKGQIELVAKQLKVATLKTDSYERLVERLIDATVGYRLRAEAIRGRGEKTRLP